MRRLADDVWYTMRKQFSTETWIFKAALFHQRLIERVSRNAGYLESAAARSMRKTTRT